MNQQRLPPNGRRGRADERDDRELHGRNFEPDRDDPDRYARSRDDDGRYGRDDPSYRRPSGRDDVVGRPWPTGGMRGDERDWRGRELSRGETWRPGDVSQAGWRPGDDEPRWDDERDRGGGRIGWDNDPERAGRGMVDDRGRYLTRDDRPGMQGRVMRSDRGAMPSRGRSMTPRPGPVNYTRSDQRIYEDVCDALTDDEDVDCTALEVKVEQGEVSLSGTVPSRDMKRRAEDIAEDIRGVKDVHNQVKVASRYGGERGRGERAIATSDDRERGGNDRGRGAGAGPKDPGRSGSGSSQAS